MTAGEAGTGNGVGAERVDAVAVKIKVSRDREVSITAFRDGTGKVRAFGAGFERNGRSMSNPCASLKKRKSNKRLRDELQHGETPFQVSATFIAGGFHCSNRKWARKLRAWPRTLAEISPNNFCFCFRALIYIVGEHPRYGIG